MLLVSASCLASEEVSHGILDLAENKRHLSDGAGQPDRILETLKTMGFKAVPQDSDQEAGEEAVELVRSQFYVQGICCASECPSIHKIMGKLQYHPK